MVKYVFVTGGVVSGLGKGIVAASIGKLFQFRGYRVGAIKIDPYLNVDPGTLNPIEHGEVFVTEEVWDYEPVEGLRFRIAEIDQDFGHYERFLGITMHPSHNITSGQVFLRVVLRERMGEYLGQTIRMIPHVTNEIKRRIREVAKREKSDVLIVEQGGTVGDIEAMPFLEAIRQLRFEEGPGNTALVHVTLVPFLETVGELKTKPTQTSVRILQSLGLQPDVIIGRSDRELNEQVKKKISLYCNVPVEAVISDPNIECIYKVPLLFERQGLGEYLCRLLGLKSKITGESYRQWVDVVSKFENLKEEVTVYMPGKYCQIVDSYISINEALKHAGAHLGVKVKIKWVETEEFESNPSKLSSLEKADGILLTPGFGSRGTEGMIMAAEYALEHSIPFLGICFGCQLGVVAFARSKMGWEEANSTEINPNTPYPVVDLLPEQKAVREKGGTMRLGAHKVFIKLGTRLYEAYKREVVYERFRHRYHIVREYAEKMENRGLVISAVDETGRVINAVEVKDHPFFVGVQFHPEFKSRPDKPSPVYLAFIEAVARRRLERS